MIFVPSIGSGELTGNQQIYTVAPGVRLFISSVLAITDGTNPATVIAYDGTSNSDPVIGEWVVAGADGFGGRDWNYPRECLTGIYVEGSGTGHSYIVEYILT